MTMFEAKRFVDRGALFAGIGGVIAKMPPNRATAAKRPDLKRNFDEPADFIVRTLWAMPIKRRD